MTCTHDSFFRDERLRRMLWVCMAWMFAAPPLSAQARVEENVVYGMYSGLALLMDVHHPAEPNGKGLIWIFGSAWQAPTTYGAWQLKQPGVQPPIFLDVGYTVFVINHRAAPRFRYPAWVEDVQRAVRFVRHNAERYGIDPDQLGGWGGSSGAHLISMLATMDGHGDPDDSDPVNRESAKLQAVVAQAGVFDFAATADQYGDFLSPLIDAADYREGSPITYVTPDDPPLLLIHGDADPAVPFQQSELMLAALEEQGVETRLIRIPGGRHGANDVPEAVRWLNRHLLGDARAEALESIIEATVPRATTVSSEILADYVGTYGLPGVDNVVTLEDNRLMMEAPGFGKFQLFAESETHFFSNEGPQLEFVRGDDGIVTHLIARASAFGVLTLPRKSNDR